MKTIALNRLNLLGMPEGPGLAPHQKLSFLAELARLGYRISNPDRLDAVSPAFLLDYKHLVDQLRKKRGGKVKYVPLFRKFPWDTPDDNTYFLKRVIGYLGNRLNLFEDAVVLENGTKVPKWLFNVYDFGADPITQMQSKELFDLAVKQEEKKSGDSHTEWIDLAIVSEAEMTTALQQFLADILYAKSSIKEALQADVFALLDFFGLQGIDPAQIVFKEIRALVLKFLWEKADYASVAQMADSATDVLRMFAAITQSDISLAEKVMFPKFSRAQRKVVLGMLENSRNLAEDLRKYKGLWLEIGRYLHPGEYAKAFPRTAQLFDLLRNGKIETYHSKTERLLAMQEFDALLAHLTTRPGIFGRRLHEVLRAFPDLEDYVMGAFEQVAQSLPLKNLLVLRTYFNTINAAEKRTVINKKGKILVLPNNAKGAMTRVDLATVTGVLDAAIYTKIASGESWEGKSVWIDPALQNYTVPLQQRKASDGILTYGRGSRINVDFDKVLRLFVYWKETRQTTDLDLSVIEFTGNFDYLGHVSYTNLQSKGIAHSGDIQSAPQGAAEFIDIRLSALHPYVKYLGVQVHLFCGEAFTEMTCHAGWMMRKNVNPDLRTFDVKTVANKFDLNGRGGYAIPLIVDLEAAQIILTDLYVSGAAVHNNVEGSTGNVATIGREIARFVSTRPVMSDLAWYHAAARNATVVDQPEDADIRFGLKDCTYNVGDVGKILSELL